LLGEQPNGSAAGEREEEAESHDLEHTPAGKRSVPDSKKGRRTASLPVRIGAAYDRRTASSDERRLTP